MSDSGFKNDEYNKIKETKTNLLLEEYKILASLFNNEKNIDFKIRNWCLTVWFLCLGSSFKLDISFQLAMLLLFIMILGFWYQNVSHAYFMYNTIRRMREVEDLLNNLNSYDIKALDKIETPKCMEKRTWKERVKFTLKAAGYKNMMQFYLILILLTFLIYQIIIPQYIASGA